MRQRDVFAPNDMTDILSVPSAFANQIEYCRANDAPITARIVSALAGLLENPSSEFARRIAGWQGAPLTDALPLRAAAAIHALHLQQIAPQLSPIFAAMDMDKLEDSAIIRAIVAQYDQRLLPWLDGPPQTNEAARSANFIAAMLWLAEQGCPPVFDGMEIGSSAGINLMMDRYHYDLGGVPVGAALAALNLQPEWRGPPPPHQAIRFARLRGCDIEPVDLRDAPSTDRLKSYIWPDHPIRFHRLKATIEAAKIAPPDLVRAQAADFVEAQLTHPQAYGTTRMLFHSIVWQYLPPDQQQRITAAMEWAGAAATPEKPLAWIAVEANRTLHRHELSVRYWPALPEPRILALSHAHGAWIDWQA